jgi:hypothetical protein
MDDATADATAQSAPEVPDSSKAPRQAGARPARRTSRRALRLWAWTAAGIGFVVPWATFNASPRPTVAPAAGQVVVVPAGWHVVSVSGAPGTSGAVKIVAPGGNAAGKGGAVAPVATTGGSTVPPP